ncbi:RNA recognition motif-containing protein [Besnoitia besnoiti]|uniref:RNA recognition motif-containing protein n=1 Tax=Besnoitia besnoiti TaxID=94643 RepID=A0A2A9M7I7_BESBE|nr:RNA recognition motif-containing protein [Besnoitia besnoiti]PFH31633.1 RNA recognition motif-containing protein [Besnoitia besnoiti]
MMNAQQQQPAAATPPQALGEGVRQLQQLQQMQLQQFEANGAGLLAGGAQPGAVAALGGLAGGAAAFGAMPLNSQMSVVEIAMQNHLSNLQAVQSAALQAKLLAEKKKTELGLGVSIGPGAGGLLPAATSLVTGCLHKETELQQLSRTVFVESFPEEYEKEELRLLLQDFGKIVGLRVGQHVERKTKYAIVEFETPEEAQFVRDMNGKPIGALTLTIKESQSLVNFRDPDGVLFDVPPPPILAVLKQQQTQEGQHESLQDKLKEVKYSKMEIEDKLKELNGQKPRAVRDGSRSRGRSDRRRRRDRSRSSSRSPEGPSGGRRSLSPRGGSRAAGQGRKRRKEGGRESSRSFSPARGRGGSGRGGYPRGPEGERPAPEGVSSRSRSPPPRGGGERAGKDRRSLERRDESRGRRGSERRGSASLGAGAKRKESKGRSISRSPDDYEDEVTVKPPSAASRPGTQSLAAGAKPGGEGRFASTERKTGGGDERRGARQGAASRSQSPSPAPGSDKRPSPELGKNETESDLQRLPRDLPGEARRQEEKASSENGFGCGLDDKRSVREDAAGARRSRSPVKRAGLLLSGRRGDSQGRLSSRSPSADRFRARENSKKRTGASASRSRSHSRPKAPGAAAGRGAAPRRPSGSYSLSPPRSRGAPVRRSPSFPKKKEDGNDEFSRERAERDRPRRPSLDARRVGPGERRMGRRSGSRSRRSSLSYSDRSLSSSPGRPRRGPPGRQYRRRPSEDADRQLSPGGRGYVRPRPRGGFPGGADGGDRDLSPLLRRRRRSASRSGDRDSLDDGPRRGGPRGGRRTSVRPEGDDFGRDRDSDYRGREGLPLYRGRGDRRGPGDAFGRGEGRGRAGGPLLAGPRRRVGSREGSLGRDRENEKGDGPAGRGPAYRRGGGGPEPMWTGGANRADNKGAAGLGGAPGPRGEDGPGYGPRGRGRQGGRRVVGRRGDESEEDGGRMDRYKSQSRSLSDEDSNSRSPSPVRRGPGAGARVSSPVPRDAGSSHGEGGRGRSAEPNAKYYKSAERKGQEGTRGAAEESGGAGASSRGAAADGAVAKDGESNPQRVQPMNALCGGRPGAA